MRPITDILLWVSQNFTAEIYLFSTKIQGIMWSIVDIALLYFLLRIIALARAKTKMKRILFRYLFLLFSVVLTPFLVFVETSRVFFYLESIICGIHFSILIYIVLAERKMILAFLRGLSHAKGKIDLGKVDMK